MYSKLAVFIPVETADGKPIYISTKDRHIFFKNFEAGVEYKIFSLDGKEIYIVPYIKKCRNFMKKMKRVFILE